jgi:hypothetical protein
MNLKTNLEDGLTVSLVGELKKLHELKLLHLMIFLSKDYLLT